MPPTLPFLSILFISKSFSNKKLDVTLLSSLVSVKTTISYLITNASNSGHLHLKPFTLRVASHKFFLVLDFLLACNGDATGDLEEDTLMEGRVDLVA